LPGKLQSILIPAVEAAGLSASSIPDLLKAVATGGEDALKTVPGMTPEILDVTVKSVANAYGQSYAYVYYTAVALGGVCIIAAASLRDFDHYLTNHVSRQVYHKEDTKVDILEKNATGHMEEAQQSA